MIGRGAFGEVRLVRKCDTGEVRIYFKMLVLIVCEWRGMCALHGPAAWHEIVDTTQHKVQYCPR